MLSSLLVRRDKIHRGRVVQIGHLTIDVDGKRVWIEGEEISLKPREYTLLEALALNEGRTLTRDVIQDRVWQNEDSFSNTVEVHVKSLRAKLDRPHLPGLILTVYGLGYSLRRPDSGTS